MTILKDLFEILVFPGFLFVLNFGLFLEWVDRKIYARVQKRIGPPWYQPWLDVLKLFTKEDVIPQEAQRFMFTVLPVLALATSVTAFLYVPIGGASSVYPFPADLVVVVFFLTLSTILLFLVGWYSGSPFGKVGSLRAATQFLAYEVPLVMSFLTPALLSNSWSLSVIRANMAQNWFKMLPVTLFSVVCALLSLQGKLLRVPFDAPEAETEIVAGPLTEYSGRRLAFLKMAERAEMVVGSALVSSLFFPLSGAWGYLGFFAVSLAVVFFLAVLRAALARLRIEDTAWLAWRYLIPVSAVGMALAILIRR